MTTGISARDKHCNAPWRAKKSKCGYYTEISADGWVAFARVVTRIEDCAKESEQGLANARLIQAAPRMFELIANGRFLSGEDRRRALDIVKEVRGPRTITERVTDGINKARCENISVDDQISALTSWQQQKLIDCVVRELDKND